MHGLILAAGRGTRLGLIGETIPKPLLTLPNGETLLGRLIRQMQVVGVHSITVVVGHMADKVVEHVDSMSSSASIDFVLAQDFATTNNVVSMLLGLDAAAKSAAQDERLLFAECDVLLTDEVFLEIVEAPNANLAVVSPFTAGMDGTVVSVEQNHISAVIPPRLQRPGFQLEGHFKTVNVYLFDERVWRRRLPRLLEWQISEVGVTDYYENAIGMIVYALDSELRAHIIAQDRWHEIDDLNDLRIANEKLFPGHDVQSILATHGGWWDLPYLDFAYLRNMYFPPPGMMAQLKEALPGLLQNYGSSQRRVDDKLSWLLNVDSEMLVSLAGLSALYPQIVSDFDTPGTWIPEETFGEYSARLPNASRYPDCDWRKVLAQNGPTAIVLVNPNNPTGALISVNEVVAAANEYSQVRFIVDESFVAFTNEPTLLSLSGLPANVLVLRSMSKEIGMPGLRLGFAYSTDTSLIQVLRSRQPVWALNSIAEFAITLMLKYRKEFIASFESFWSDKDAMAETLSEEPGITVRANVNGCFLLVDVDNTRYPNVVDVLAKSQILVKDVTGRVTMPRDATVLRLAVRPREDVIALVAGIRLASDQSCQ